MSQIAHFYWRLWTLTMGHRALETFLTPVFPGSTAQHGSDSAGQSTCVWTATISEVTEAIARLSHIPFTLFTHLTATEVAAWWPQNHHLQGQGQGQGHILASLSPGAAQRHQHVCLQCTGGNIVFTNSKDLCLCFFVPLQLLWISKYTQATVQRVEYCFLVPYLPFYSRSFCSAFLFAFWLSTNYFWALITHLLTCSVIFVGFLTYSPVRLATLLCVLGSTGQTHVGCHMWVTGPHWASTCRGPASTKTPFTRVGDWDIGILVKSTKMHENNKNRNHRQCREGIPLNIEVTHDYFSICFYTQF